MDGKRLLVICLLASLGQFIPWIVFNTFAQDKAHLLEELYQIADVESKLKWVRHSMALRQQQFALPKPVIDTVNQLVAVRYSPKYFRSSMKDTLDEALSLGEMQRLLQWYHSPLGQKILRLEAQANDPANVADIEAYIKKELSHQLPRSNRVLLIEELMKTLDSVSLITDLEVSASEGALRLLKEVLPMRGGWLAKSIESQAKKKPEIFKEMSIQMRNIFFYTYRSLPDHEIRTYLDFARETAMQNFQRGQMKALARML